MSGGIIVADPPSIVYVPAANGSVVALIAIEDTDDSRDAAAKLADTLLANIAAPHLVIVDFRAATVIALELERINSARLPTSER